MDYSNLVSQVRNAAITTANYSKELDLAEVRERLFNIDIESVIGRLRANRPLGWSGAVPTGEPLTTNRPSSHLPSPVIGIDGSQVYPAADHPVRWAYIQAALYPWSGQQPVDGQFIEIGEIERYQLIDDEGDYFNSIAYVDALRTLIELQTADVAVQHFPEAVVLLDNPLLPYDARFLDGYPDFLGKMRGALLAGYVSRPRSHLIYYLLRLAYEDAEFPFATTVFDDTQLMRSILEIGHRSAVFLHGSWRNIDMESAGAGIYFFFLRLNEYEIARVEIPEWIAHSPDTLDLIHSSILADSQELQYPNALLMAHKAVVLPKRVGRQLNDLALRVYMQNGGEYYESAKKQAKGQ